MFNGPCQLHGSTGFISTADEALLTPTGYVNTSVTGIPLPHGLRPPSPLPPLLDPAVAPCSADHCLMSPGLTCPDVYMALEGVQFLAEHTRREQYTIRVKKKTKKFYRFVPYSYHYTVSIVLRITHTHVISIVNSSELLTQLTRLLGFITEL